MVSAERATMRRRNQPLARIVAFALGFSSAVEINNQGEKAMDFCLCEHKRKDHNLAIVETGRINGDTKCNVKGCECRGFSLRPSESNYHDSDDRKKFESTYHDRAEHQEAALVALGGILASNVQNMITMKNAVEMAWEASELFVAEGKRR